MAQQFVMDIVVQEVTPIQTVGQKGFSKRTIIGEEFATRYDPLRQFTVFGKDLCKGIDLLRAGDRIRVKFSVRGHSYNGRVYTDLSYEGHEAMDEQDAAPDAPPPPAEVDMSASLADETPPF